MDKTDDDSLKQLFANFSPELTPDDAFTRRLAVRLEGVEAIRNWQRERNLRYRRSVVVAAAAGLLTGLLVALLLPFLPAAAAAISRMLPAARLYLPVYWLLAIASAIPIFLTSYLLATRTLR